MTRTEATRAGRTAPDPARATAELQLPRPPGVLRRQLAAHPLIVDGTIAGCYLLGVLFMALIDIALASMDGGGTGLEFPPYLTFPLLPLLPIKTSIVFLALLARRRFPLAALSAVALVSLALQTDTAHSLADATALLFAVYAVPVYRSVRAGWAGWGIAVAATALNLWLFGSDSEVADAAALVFGVLTLLLTLLIGINLGNRRRYLAAIIDRAHQLARERDQLAQLAVAEERARITRDMHDIVAHSVSVMIALSEGAARAAEVAPEAASEAMRRSAETGRTALAEMRRMLGALSDPVTDPSPAALAPQPGIAEISGLVETFRSAGIPVALEVRGSSAGDRGQELAVYRLVQEALTNVLRHAGEGASAHVGIAHGLRATAVEVVNGAATPRYPSAVPWQSLADLGSGRGLRGLAERVRVFGGTFESGELPGGGWRVRAVIPVNASARGVSEAAPQPGVEAERAADGQNGEI